MTTNMRRIHADDFKAITAHFRKANPYAKRFRVEFKDLELKQPHFIPEHWPLPCRPMDLDSSKCDSAGETMRDELRIPTDADFWLDVQMATNAEPPGYEPFWEPLDWVRAEFSNGRLMRLV